MIVCRSCGTKAQVRALLFSGVLGWWGIPWGLFITPMQIVRNINALRKSTDPFVPSDELRHVAQLHLARQGAAARPREMQHVKRIRAALSVQK